MRRQRAPRPSPTPILIAPHLTLMVVAVGIAVAWVFVRSSIASSEPSQAVSLVGELLGIQTDGGPPRNVWRSPFDVDLPR